MDYDKQSINVDEQVALLQNRGLVIEERACVIGKLENESLEERIMAVLDYISGMTDIYALDIYQKINGISLPIV